MKFSVGYQLRRDTAFVDEIIAQKEHIHEVYFSWGTMPNGRNNQLSSVDFLPFQAQARQLEDIQRIHKAGIALNLLLNANCYGKDSLSRMFFNELGDLVDYLRETLQLGSITTTSPMIAKFIKDNFKSIEVRASINMRIGTIEGMEYIADVFDGYYMQREFNRSIERIQELKGWCDRHEKKLYALANSGCLNYCSAQTFHDNLVAHENDIAAMDNAYNFTAACKKYLSDETNYQALIDKTNFIRPEDICLYEEYFTAMKLATRVSRDPINILRSYVRGEYTGNVLELLEPYHNIYPYAIENGTPLKLVKMNTDIFIYGENTDEKGESRC